MTDRTPDDPSLGRYDDQERGAVAPDGRAWPAEGRSGAAPRNGMGLGALIVGLIALVLAVLFFPLGILLGIVAIILGVIGRKRVARGEADNGGQATAGLVLGVLAVVIGALLAVWLGNWLADNADEFGNLTECLQDAGGDAEAQQSCQEEFEEQVVGAPAWRTAG